MGHSPTTHHHLVQHICAVVCSFRMGKRSILLQALSDSHVQLYNERRNLLVLQKANDELRLTSLAQMRQIRSLRSHCPLQNCRHPDCTSAKDLHASSPHSKENRSTLNSPGIGRRFGVLPMHVANCVHHCLGLIHDNAAQ